MRHSSASLYCKKIDNPYKFCYRYGWKFGSHEANRYIDRNLLGEDEQEKLQNVIEQDRMQDLEQELNTRNKQMEGKLRDTRVQFAKTLRLQLSFQKAKTPEEMNKIVEEMERDTRLMEKEAGIKH